MRAEHGIQLAINTNPGLSIQFQGRGFIFARTSHSWAFHISPSIGQLMVGSHGNSGRASLLSILPEPSTAWVRGYTSRLTRPTMETLIYSIRECTAPMTRGRHGIGLPDPRTAGTLASS